MAGGRIIEVQPMRLVETGVPVVRLWVMDQHDTETCVYAREQDDMPSLGDEVWWQAMKIYFGPNDSKHLDKVGFSFSPRSTHPEPRP